MTDIEIKSKWRCKHSGELAIVDSLSHRCVVYYIGTQRRCSDIVYFLNNYEPQSEFFKRQDKEGLKISPAMIRGIHPYSFRSGEWATIVGLVVCGKDYPGGRLNYMVMFDDGKVDYWPVCDESNHEIKAASEVSK